MAIKNRMIARIIFCTVIFAHSTAAITYSFRDYNSIGFFIFSSYLYLHRSVKLSTPQVRKQIRRFSYVTNADRGRIPNVEAFDLDYAHSMAGGDLYIVYRWGIDTHITRRFTRPLFLEILR